MVIFCNLSEKFTQELWVKGKYFSTGFTLHMFVMMFVRVYFILFDSSFKTHSAKNSNLTKEFYSSKNTGSPNIWKARLNVTSRKNMKLLHLCKEFFSLRSDAFFLSFKYIFYFHNWDLVSIKVFEIYGREGRCQKKKIKISKIYFEILKKKEAQPWGWASSRMSNEKLILLSFLIDK